MARCPKISIPAGSDVAIVEVTGDIRNQEPGSVRVRFPGGEMEIVRVGSGPDVDYWCHLRIVRPGDDETVLDGEPPARVVDGRIDVKGKHASDCDAGDLAHPDLYHLAVRVTRRDS